MINIKFNANSTKTALVDPSSTTEGPNLSYRVEKSIKFSFLSLKLNPYIVYNFNDKNKNVRILKS